ncbi:helix-turn-helix transcriptional regulator, partial [Pseudomonas sp. MPR-R2A6]
VLDGLAGVVRLSTGHFCRAFKVTVGETPHAFLIRRRIRRAQTLMLTTKDSLSHIACTCGLTDQAHLTRLFRRMVGDTPLSWRRTWSHMFERGELG